MMDQPAAPARKAVAMNQHKVDVLRSLGDAFLEDRAGLGDHRKGDPFDDLVGCEVAPGIAQSGRDLTDFLRYKG